MKARTLHQLGFTLAASLCASTGASLAMPIPPYGAFIYSTLCWSKESGDARGIRVTVLRYPMDTHLLFEWSEGPLYERSGYKVGVDPITSHVTFEVDMDATMTSPDWELYSGEISNEELIITASSNKKRIYRLPRVQDFGREGKTCSE